MGTHPIFESDFDCLTEKKIWGNGVEKRKDRRRSQFWRKRARSTLNMAAIGPNKARTPSSGERANDWRRAPTVSSTRRRKWRTKLKSKNCRTKTLASRARSGEHRRRK